jgi:hypothetical protein
VHVVSAHVYPQLGFCVHPDESGSIELEQVPSDAAFVCKLDASHCVCEEPIPVWVRRMRDPSSLCSAVTEHVARIPTNPITHPTGIRWGDPRWERLVGSSKSNITARVLLLLFADPVQETNATVSGENVSSEVRCSLLGKVPLHNISGSIR